MWVSAWVAVAWFATLFLYQYLRYHFSGHPLRQPLSSYDSRPFARVGLGVSEEVRPLLVPLFAEKRQRIQAGEARACEFGLRHLIRIAARPL